MEMIKIVKGTEKEVMELQANLFARIPVVAKRLASNLRQQNKENGGTENE